MTPEAAELSPNFILPRTKSYAEFRPVNRPSGVYLGRDNTVLVNTQEARAAGIIQIGLVGSERDTVWDAKDTASPARGPMKTFDLIGGQQLRLKFTTKAWSWKRLRFVDKTLMAALITPLGVEGEYHYKLIVEDGLHKPA